jgi:GAF domain-containing protein
MPNQRDLDGIIDELAATNLSGFPLREKAMTLLSGLDTYDWSGIYVLDGDELQLDAYVGEETDHVRIPVGIGVCGTAVAQNRNQVVGDVRNLENYLACSVSTRSEIVVLIRNEQGHILGQIDIDGHAVGSFDEKDEVFLECLASLLAERWE